MSHLAPLQPEKQSHVEGVSTSAVLPSASSLLALTHAPCTHPPEQERCAQSLPPHPAAQSQVPTAVHLPWPLQLFGQSG